MREQLPFVERASPSAARELGARAVACVDPKPFSRNALTQNAERSGSRRRPLNKRVLRFGLFEKAPRVNPCTKPAFVEKGAFRISRLRQGGQIEMIPWADPKVKSGPPPKEERVNRDPLALARFYQSLLDSGVAENRAGLARYLGVSRARVTQVLRRLRPEPNGRCTGERR